MISLTITYDFINNYLGSYCRNFMWFLKNTTIHDEKV